MKFETLKSFNKKKLIIPIGIISCLIIVITIFVSQAKYISKDSITIIDDEVNYKPYDFKILGIYQQKETCTNSSDNDCYEEKDKMPSEEYEINKDKTYCFVDYDDEEHKIKNNIYTNDNGEHIIKELPKRSKCYLYLDKTKPASEKTFDKLASLNKSLTSGGVIDTNGIRGTSCDERCALYNDNGSCKDAGCNNLENGIYEAKDDDGTSYYFRGTVDNNYVKFGKMGNANNPGADIWWRIIRINGDGSIRMIYAGTSTNGVAPNQTNDTSVITVSGQTTFTYSPGGASGNNMYVGFEYVSGIRNGHANNKGSKTATKSNALQQLETWFIENLSDEFGENTKIDKNAGFCGDRSAYDYDTRQPNNNLGTGAQNTLYGGFIRTNKPTLQCPDKDNDLFTYKDSIKGTQSLEYPIGLITADEVTYAGGLYSANNSRYYLYNNTKYWTMSPFSLNWTGTYIFAVFSSGLTGVDVSDEYVLRPVINLTPNSIISGNGKSSDPFKTV